MQEKKFEERGRDRFSLSRYPASERRKNKNENVGQTKTWGDGVSPKNIELVSICFGHYCEKKEEGGRKHCLGIPITAQ